MPPAVRTRSVVPGSGRWEVDFTEASGCRPTLAGRANSPWAVTQTNLGPCGDGLRNHRL